MHPRVPIIDRTVCDIFASHADDFWALGKLELRYTYLLHGISLALEKAIVPGYVPQDGSFNFRMYEPHYMIHIPQHLLINMLAKRAGKTELYKKHWKCEWDDEDLKIAEKGMCVADDLVETIAPYARAHAEKLAQAVSRE